MPSTDHPPCPFSLLPSLLRSPLSFSALLLDGKMREQERGGCVLGGKGRLQQGDGRGRQERVGLPEGEGQAARPWLGDAVECALRKAGEVLG